MKELRGTGVALITPFDANNQVDIVALERLIKHQIDNNYCLLFRVKRSVEASRNSTHTTKGAQKVRQQVLVGAFFE